MTSPIVKAGQMCISMENGGHKTGTRSAGFDLIAADATIVNTASPPYGTYALRLDFNKAAYTNRASVRSGSGASPTLGGIPIQRYVLPIKHTTAHPSAAITVAHAVNALGGVGDTLGYHGFMINTSGVLQLLMTDTLNTQSTLGVVATGLTVMALNTWYFIEHLIRQAGTTYQHVVRLYNSTGAYLATEIDISGQKGPPVAIALQLGEANTGAAGSRGCEVYFGPLYCANEDGAADLLKPTIRRLVPNGAGTYNEWGGRAYDAAGVNIVSSTNASPINIQATAHGLVTGDHVEVAGPHATNTNANGTFTVTKVDNDNVTLDGSTGNGVGGATGTIRKCNPVNPDGAGGGNFDDLYSGGTPDGTTYTASPENDTALGIHIAISTIATRRHTSTMTNLTANDVPYVVSPGAWMAKDSTKGTTPNLILYNGTEVVCGAELAADPVLTFVTSNAEGSGHDQVNAPGSTGWTLAQVDACECGVKQSGSSSNDRVRVSAFWMDVAVNANEANWAPFPQTPKRNVFARQAVNRAGTY